MFEAPAKPKTKQERREAQQLPDSDDELACIDQKLEALKLTKPKDLEQF